jgi:hypothetical protein
VAVGGDASGTTIITGDGNVTGNNNIVGNNNQVRTVNQTGKTNINIEKADGFHIGDNYGSAQNNQDK